MNCTYFLYHQVQVMIIIKFPGKTYSRVPSYGLLRSSNPIDLTGNWGYSEPYRICPVIVMEYWAPRCIGQWENNCYCLCLKIWSWSLELKAHLEYPWIGQWDLLQWTGLFYRFFSSCGGSTAFFAHCCPYRNNVFPPICALYCGLLVIWYLYILSFYLYINLELLLSTTHIKLGINTRK